MIREAKRTRASRPDWQVSAAIKGADLALRVPWVRDFFLDLLLKHLGTSYDDCEDDTEVLRHVQWFARQLRPFLHRLINDRPAAARAILRFLGTWIRDVYKRTNAQDEGAATPCTVVVELTDRCNLNCPGCYAKSTREGSDLPYEQIEQIIQQVADMGVTLITISGGEPFLREKEDQAITRLAEKFNDRGFLVYTNGTLIDNEVAARLGRVGNVFPAISVEGFEHHTDARRGKGIYEQNRRAREALARYGVMTGFSATVTSENCESICTDDFLDLRIAEGDLFGWFFLLQPIGRSPRPDLMVSAEQRARLRQTIYRWREQQRPIFLGDFWNDGHLTGGCIAGGRYYFHIYANGDISPCVFVPLASGNVFDIIHGKTPYRNLWEFVQGNPMFQAYRTEQQGITDRNRPCLLIDHPEAMRRCCGRTDHWFTKNMPEGYLDGDIAHTLDVVSSEWCNYCRTQLPPTPAEREADDRQMTDSKAQIANQ